MCTPKVPIKVFAFLVILCCKTSASADNQHNIFELNEGSMIIRETVTENFDVLKTVSSSIEDTACRNHADLIIAGLYNLTDWAVKFYDASAKIPIGLLGGSTYQFGNFDECLDIGVEGQQLPAGLEPKYCLGDIKILVNGSYADNRKSIWYNFRRTYKRYDESITKVHWGICIPSTCSTFDIQHVVKKLIDITFNNSQSNINPHFESKRCYRNEVTIADAGDIIYLIIILGVLVIIAVGTIFHIVCLKKGNDEFKGILPQILIAFSIIGNLKKLFGPTHEDTLNLNCISGIKFMAMGFIVAGHCLVFVVGGPMLNKKFWEEAMKKVENSVFLNNPLLVDTFLFLSGFLFSRILLRELDKRKSVNFLLLYIFRYIRITPAYLVMIGLYVTWLSKLDSGPLWSRMIAEKARCQESWWANTIYINNYVNTDRLCMFQSWYLSVDTQLFILAPAIIYPLWRWRKLGEFILAGVTAISVIIPFTVTYVSDLDPTLMIYIKEMEDVSENDYFKNTYIKTHMRASAYSFGLIFGYIVYRIQIIDYRMSTMAVRIGWTLGSLFLIASMFSIELFYGPRKNFTVIEAAVYSSIHRVLWSLGTGWVILACVTDNAGPIRNFLEWSLFVPLSRLTYSAYLVNGLVELHSISTIRTPQHLDTISLFRKVMSHLVLTFFGAVVLSTMFEAPILALEKIFLRPTHPDVKGENSGKNITEEIRTTQI